MEQRKSTAFSIRDLLGLQHQQRQHQNSLELNQERDECGLQGTEDIEHDKLSDNRRNSLDGTESHKLPVDTNSNNLIEAEFKQLENTCVAKEESETSSNNNTTSAANLELTAKEINVCKANTEQQNGHKGQHQYLQQRQQKKHHDATKTPGSQGKAASPGIGPSRNVLPHDSLDPRLGMLSMGVRDVAGIDSRLDSTGLRWRGSQMDTLSSSGQPMLNFNLFSSQNGREIFGYSGKLSL